MGASIPPNRQRPLATLDASAVAQPRGMRVYRASRLEALLAPLAELLHATWPDNPLEPATVIAAHAGIKHWLGAALARQAGPDGIVANLDIVLPSSWIERQAQALLGKTAISRRAYQRRHLRWVVHGLLASPGSVPGLSDPRVLRYLAADAADAGAAGDLARRRFQLADRLAQLYAQYMVYRPDWLRSWHKGQCNAATAGNASADLAATEGGLLAPLWQAISATHGEHRGGITAQLIRRLEHDDGALPAVHVFATSHLAPAELAVLQAWSRRGLVALYLADPCREYWGLLSAAPDIASFCADEDQRLAAAGSGDYWSEQAHPLLARWGRLGQHFFAAVASGDGVREDLRHWQDDRDAPPPNRLARLQESIRRLQPAVLAEPARGAAEADTDASLRVHACHTPLRELEVLRDALLHAIEHDGVRAGDMVVMAPDIGAYAALIPAVFGEPGSARQRLLPYHLADVAVAASHPLFSTFQRLLELPASRISAPQVVDLLGVAEVQRRFGLDADALDNLTEWLQHSRVAWSLDGAHRASLGVPPIHEHGFAWAVDRMVAGYLMSDAADEDQDHAFVLPDGTELTPVTGVQGPGAEALGALDALLVELRAWLDLADRRLKASEWSRLLDLRLDALFRIDPGDADARAALAAVKQFIGAVASEPDGAGLDPELHFAVVRDLLLEQLASVPEHQRFLMGGVTFCGMVPQRAIPFDVVAVLGLDDGAFPRARADGGLDLMARLRRRGDREVRDDDRYLLLETVMSARRRLHLSHVGEGVKDGKRRNPAAPLAELLAELDRTAGLAHDADDTRRPWLVRHPLQPFDVRYFNASDTRLFTYQPRFAGMAARTDAPARVFIEPSGLPADTLPDPLPLAVVARYYKDPAGELLHDRLGIDLTSLDEQCLPDEEPLAPAVAPIHGVTRKVFFKDVLPAWPARPWKPAAAPAWLRLGGILPPGRLGGYAWDAELDMLDALLQAAQDSGWLDAQLAQRGSGIALDLEIVDRTQAGTPALRVGARIEQVFPLPPSRGAGWQLVRAFPDRSKRTGLKAEADLGFGERVPLFLDWALLRLHSARAAGEGALPAVRITALMDTRKAEWLPGLMAWDEALLRAQPADRAGLLDDLEHRLVQLIRWWREAQATPRWYFARTSWAAARAATAATADAALDGSSIREAWEGNSGSGERHHAPGFNQWFGGSEALADDSAALAELCDFATALDTCLRLGPSSAEGA